MFIDWFEGDTTSLGGAEPKWCVDIIIKFRSS